MNSCCGARFCTCAVIDNRPTVGDYVLIALCIAVYLGAFALAIWPPGVP